MRGRPRNSSKLERPGRVSATWPAGARRSTEPTSEHSAIESRIRAALRDQSLQMVFQPIVNIRTGEVTGAESLARFRTEPYRTPDVWFAEAHVVGLGLELELEAVQRALSQLAHAVSPAYFTLNVAPDTLGSPRLAEVLESVPGERVVLELTEHARIDDYDLVHDALVALRSRGVRLAIDDAGAGFANFQHILRLRPDVIKLDRSLTTGIDKNAVRYALASALVTFAASLGATLCAEGIETADELVALQQLGVGFGQGYFLGRPAPLPVAAPPPGLWFVEASRPLAEEARGSSETRRSSRPFVPSPAVRAPARLAALAATGLMDSPSQEDFDRFTRLAARLLAAPSSLVSLVDDHRQLFKGKAGDAVLEQPAETPLGASLCQHAVTAKLPLVIDDAAAHPLLHEMQPNDLGAYLGVPIITGDAQVLGALCVLDKKPRRWTDADVRTLTDVAELVAAYIDAHTALLRASDGEHLLELVFEDADTPMTVIDVGGRFARANGSFCALVGAREEDLVGKPFATIEHEADIAASFTARNEVLSGHRAEVEFTTRLRREPGPTWIQVPVRASVFRNTRRHARGMLLRVPSRDRSGVA